MLSLITLQLQQNISSNYSVFSRICSGYHSGVWNRCWFWYIWGWDLPNAVIKNSQMGCEWVLLFFSFQTNESFEYLMNTCLLFIKAPKTWICWCIHVKSRWIKLYTKIWHQIRHNELRHENLSEDWYLDPAVVSLYQGHGCHTVNNTWRLSLHVSFCSSVLKYQNGKVWSKEIWNAGTRSKQEFTYLHQI